MAISRMDMERQLRAGGGIMTLDEPRQGYFLGKLVRKAKKAVKKVVKSPLGKAALLGAASFGIPGTAFGGLFGRASLGGAAKGIFGNVGGIGKLLGSGGKFSTIGDVFRKGGKEGEDFSALRLLGGGLGAAAIAAPFLMGGDEEEVIDESTPFNLAQPMVSDIRQQARSYYQDPTKSALFFMPPKSAVQDRFFTAAGGGLADIPRGGYSEGESVLSKEQMAMISDMKDKGMDMSTIASITGATTEQITNYLSSLNQKADGGIMDLGGMEKDYREGGFVPLGAEERADDVPARLSKNEFVFTADAVRNAGQGDIDKGAEVMQNMMDNLEAGGTISEESQGEENPAQAMFDQSQMLENRIV
jgi:hypothetical protein